MFFFIIFPHTNLQYAVPWPLHLVVTAQVNRKEISEAFVQIQNELSFRLLVLGFGEIQSHPLILASCAPHSAGSSSALVGGDASKQS